MAKCERFSRAYGALGSAGFNMTILELLKSLDFGQSVAEQEIDNLHKYFVQTKQWEDLIAGGVDIVYGPKGSGKSALYTLLNNNGEELLKRNIILQFAENPRGTTVFSDLQTNPPAKELEFVNLWKLYLLTLIGNQFALRGPRTYEGLEVVETLRDSGLISEPGAPIKEFLSRARAYIKQFFDLQSFEPNVSFNEVTGTPDGVGVKVTFREPNPDQTKKGALSVDGLIMRSNRELDANGMSVWFLLDRLDVAFADSPELEANALRALFKVYLDLSAYDRIKLKIFLRTDIWGRITQYGFREATHITRTTTITWETQTLLNLIIRRFLSNDAFNEFYQVEPGRVLSSIAEQEKLFNRVFPEKIDSGRNPTTLKWLAGHTSDAKGNHSPRDVINLIKFAITRQIRLLEIGETAPPSENLFQRVVVKNAFSDTSIEKVEKHLFAEYPGFRRYFEGLRGAKSEHTAKSLSELWGVSIEKALGEAQNLVEIGFWIRDGAPGAYRYWIPLIYRDGLGIIQGQADKTDD